MCWDQNLKGLVQHFCLLSSLPELSLNVCAFCTSFFFPFVSQWAGLGRRVPACSFFQSSNQLFFLHREKKANQLAARRVYLPAAISAATVCAFFLKGRQKLPFLIVPPTLQLDPPALESQCRWSVSRLGCVGGFSILFIFKKIQCISFSFLTTFAKSGGWKYQNVGTQDSAEPGSPSELEWV